MSDNTEEDTINTNLTNDELDAAVLENNLGRIAYTLDKDYLSHLDDYGVFKFEEYCKDNGIEYKEDGSKGYAALKVTNFIINKDEKVIDCMKNVIASFSNSNDSLAFVVQRKKESVNLYFIFKKNGNIKDSSVVGTGVSLLQKSFEGNFQGSKVEEISNHEIIKQEFGFLEGSTHIALLSSVPSDKSEDYISQGIEKLLNGVVPVKEDEEYAVMILAESLTQESIRDIINGFEQMATAITPYASHQFQRGKNNSESKGEMHSSTDTTGISHAISKTHSINIGINAGRGTTTTSGINNAVTDSETDTVTEGVTDTEGNSISDTVSESNTKGSSDSAGISFIGQYNHGWNRSKTTGTAKTIVKNVAKSFLKSTAKSIGKAVTAGTFSSVAKMLSVGISGGYGYSWGKIDTNSESKSLTDGTNHNITVGTSENTTYNYKSYQVNDLIQNLETTIKRLMQSKSTGLWKSATYVFSKDGATARSVANYLRGLTQGDESYIETATVQEWAEDEKKKNTPFLEIRKYLTHFIHPIFVNRNDLNFNDKFKEELIQGIKDEANKENLPEDVKKEIESEIRNSEAVDLIPITPTTNISTTELAKIFSLPTHSLPGLPVLECAEFGRTVASYDEKNFGDKSASENEDLEHTTKLGCVYHMYHPESIAVELNTNSLASHTFITGSTGSGKSNTIYQMLSELSSQKVLSENKDDNDEEENVKFLVVEPAKGEYKNVFGEKQGVNVYGTNPEITSLLRLNPFSFPNGNNEDAAKNIHILEHLDRLIEIFNVCWPMYAAMPAVLKEAVEKSYEDAGWNLTESTNPYGKNLYPTFADVARNVKLIIDSSEYDAENKGAYKGALVTRLKSLTNGINGLLFTTDEITDKDLFDKNVIVDLSRVGSSETKSLIMGLLVLKLQEYRMTTCEMNSALRHVTVLEEAHNLLKRTSTEQTSDSGNLRGKSVEMLANAIAEMRTYGEGFIIADQAPALLDMSVIRNTNTKIIMRLPDLGDRELVGKAANLNDNQITELAKLPCGVAAVYQNEWVQSVLCKVKEFKYDGEKYSCVKEKLDMAEDTLKNRIEVAKMLCNTPTDPKILNDLQDKRYKFSGSLYVNTKKYIDSTHKKPDYNKLSFIVSEMLPEFTKKLKGSAIQHPSEVEVWRNDLQEYIEGVLQNLQMQEETVLRNNILQCILQNYILNELNKPNLLKELQPRPI